MFGELCSHVPEWVGAVTQLEAAKTAGHHVGHLHRVRYNNAALQQPTRHQGPKCNILMVCPGMGRGLQVAARCARLCCSNHVSDKTYGMHASLTGCRCSVCNLPYAADADQAFLLYFAIRMM